MGEMTLRELCNVVGVSRRAIQGYERAGLVAPTGKTTRGYLLYNTAAQERIRKIKLFQNMGFQSRDIQEIIDGPNDRLRAALIERKAELAKNIRQENDMIDIIQQMLQDLT